MRPEEEAMAILPVLFLYLRSEKWAIETLTAMRLWRLLAAYRSSYMSGVGRYRLQHCNYLSFARTNGDLRRCEELL